MSRARPPLPFFDRSRFIVSPRYDVAFFLAPPLLALLAGVLIGRAGWSEPRFWHGGRRVAYVAFAIGALTHAHLAAVFFRSHGNGEIFRRHPLRFTVAPLAVLAAMLASDYALVGLGVLVVFWDVYHSALQTFGLARLYDQRAGNDARTGRRLDLALSLFTYVGPIAAGGSMLAHVDRLRDFEDLGVALFSDLPSMLTARQHALAWALLAAGALLSAGYAACYARLSRRGYRVAWPKVWLLISTALSSLVAWGWNPFGQAFVIMNLFHAVQYIALVWWSDGRQLFASVRRPVAAKRLAPVAFVVPLLAYGAWAELVIEDQRLFWSITQTVALMHFWYDGFLWSVRRSGASGTTRARANP